jgi:protein TonB
MKNHDQFKKYGIYKKNKSHIRKTGLKNIKSFIIDDLIRDKSAKANRQVRYSRLFFNIGLCLSLMLMITAFEWKFYDKGKLIDLGNLNTNFENLVDVPPTEQPPPPQPKLVQPKIVEVADEEEIIENIEIDLDIEMTEDLIIDQPVFDEMQMDVEDEKVDEIFTIVEQQPEPVGGFAAFYKYVGENLKYPRLAEQSFIQGRVYLEFVVERDGTLTDIKVMKGIGGGCDEEACRIIAGAPKWKPGKQRGRPVRVKMVMPILFRLEVSI